MKILELKDNEDIYIINKNNNKSLHIINDNNKFICKRVSDFKTKENIIIKNINYDDLAFYINTSNLINCLSIPDNKKIYKNIENMAYEKLYGKEYSDFYQRIKTTNYEVIFRLYTNEELKKEKDSYSKLIKENK